MQIQVLVDGGKEYLTGVFYCEVLLLVFLGTVCLRSIVMYFSEIEERRLCYLSVVIASVVAGCFDPRFHEVQGVVVLELKICIVG